MGHRFSASQVETFALCPRKWAWYKIDGIKSDKGNKSAEFGKETHGVLESWLRDAKAVDTNTEAGQVAMSGLHHLPLPKTVGLEVEQAFSLEIGGHTFLGYKDFQILSRVPPLVGDHKTTKDFRWAKTEAELVTNYQAALYAADAMFRANSPDCELLWVYYKTSGPRQSKKVHLRVTRDMIEPTLGEIVGLCNQMEKIVRAGISAREVPINPTACEAYGGCEYINNCNLNDNERAIAIMNQAKQQDFLGKLEGRANGINSPPAVPTPAPAGPAPVPGIPQPVWDGTQWVIPQAPPPVVAAPPPQQPPPAGPPPAGEAAPEQKKRGRPKKIVTEAAFIGAPGTPAAAAASTEESDDENEDLRVQMGTLLDQAAALIKTCAAMIRGM